MTSNDLIGGKPLAKGDVLYWVPSLESPNSKKEIVVDKVGRKWFTIVDGWRNWKASIESLEIVSERGWGKCFRTEKELYDAIDRYCMEKAANQAWDKLNTKMRGAWKKPDHLSAETILKAMEILGWSEA